MTTPPPRLAQMAKRLRELKDRKELLEEELKGINKEAKQLQEVDMPRIMSDAEIDKFSVPECGTIYIKDALFVSMAPGDVNDMEAPFYDWAREHAPDLISQYIHPARLKSWAKERLEENMPLPDNLLKAAFVPTATLLRK